MRRFSLVVGSVVVLSGCTNSQKLCIQGTTLSCLCASGQPGVALCLDGETASACNCPQPADPQPPSDLATVADMARSVDALDANRRYVFVTASTYQGNFANSDRICADAAAGAGLPGGTWCGWNDDIAGRGMAKACLDDGSQARVWYQTDAPGRPGYKVGTPDNLEAPIHRDQYGDLVVANPNIWIGQDCKPGTGPSWTTNDSMKVGTYITVTSILLSGPWDTQPCSARAHLLCFQK